MIPGGQKLSLAIRDDITKPRRATCRRLIFRLGVRGGTPRRSREAMIGPVRRVILFAREPVRDRSKTRLAREIGAGPAAVRALRGVLQDLAAALPDPARWDAVLAHAEFEPASRTSSGRFRAPWDLLPQRRRARWRASSPAPSSASCEWRASATWSSRERRADARTGGPRVGVRRSRAGRRRSSRAECPDGGSLSWVWRE